MSEGVDNIWVSGFEIQYTEDITFCQLEMRDNFKTTPYEIECTDLFTGVKDFIPQGLSRSNQQ